MYKVMFLPAENGWGVYKEDVLLIKLPKRSDAEIVQRILTDAFDRGQNQRTRDLVEIDTAIKEAELQIKHLNHQRDLLRGKDVE